MNKHEHYKQLQILLIEALEKVQDQLTEQDVTDVREYVENGEYGVGWELLWYLIDRKGLEVSAELIASGKMMDFDIVGSTKPDISSY